MTAHTHMRIHYRCCVCVCVCIERDTYKKNYYVYRYTCVEKRETLETNRVENKPNFNNVEIHVRVQKAKHELTHIFRELC